MKMLRSVKVLALAGLVVAPTVALPWRAWNRHEVLPVSDGVWEVVSEIGSGATDYWCGAGDYAIRQLRTSATQRIYIWQAIGPSVNRPGKKSVQFALSAPAGADTSVGYSVTVKRAGDNMTASMAQKYCYDRVSLEPWLAG